ncbi:MAG TPA: hypothetical protein GX400_21285 [Chloroflexi bacterium]|nr:hypothetical protein [Chloroflexota bacterium]
MKRELLKLVLWLWLLGLSAIFATALLHLEGQHAVAAGSVRFAAPIAVGVGDCSSWANACTLQQALSAAVSGDQVWVQAGVHKPGLVRNDAFALKTGVTIYGGFPVTATGFFTERAPALFVTVLSGDIDNNDAVDARGVVTNATGIVGANSYHVVTASGVDATARLDGVTVTGGQADAPTEPDNIGGGLRSVNADAVLDNVSLMGNLARSGGAIFADAGSDLTLRGLVLIGNRAVDVGGGALHSRNSSPSLTNVFLGRNTAPFGGALYNDGSAPTVVNAVFSGNQATNVGGAILNQNASNLRLVNATLYANGALIRGGGLYNLGSQPTLINVILWGNTAPLQAQVSDDLTATTTITTSLVQGGWPGVGIIDADPRFVDADGVDNISGTADDDLRLQSTSPALNIGANAALPGGVTTDLAGQPRIVQGAVDLGAYEFQLPVQQLRVAGLGTGVGEVLSAPGGVNCLIESGVASGDCTASFVAGAVITLTATEDVDSRFTGWAGCDGVNGGACSVTLNANRSVTATFQALRTLGVGGAGSGVGVVNSAPSGIACTLNAGAPAGDCSEVFVDGTPVPLTATAAASSQFTAWSGCDSVTGTGCTVAMTANRSVVATFTALRTLIVSGAGAGEGVVTSAPPGVACTLTAGSATGDCTEPYLDGTIVTLTATAAAGSTFVGWGGACSGVSPVVTVTLALINKSCTANFARNSPAQFALTITAQGDGFGVVSSTPAGIDCTVAQGGTSGDCVASFDMGAEIVLTPVAAPGSEFTGWHGDADCSDGRVVLTEARQCSARFNLSLRSLYLPMVRRQ